MVKKEVDVILAATPQLPAERFHRILDRLQAGAVVEYHDFYQMLESILTACRHRPEDDPKPKDPKLGVPPGDQPPGPMTIQDYCTHIIYLWFLAKNVGLTAEQWATLHRIIQPFQLPDTTRRAIRTVHEGGTLTQQQWVDVGDALWNACRGHRDRPAVPVAPAQHPEYEEQKDQPPGPPIEGSPIGVYRDLTMKLVSYILRLDNVPSRI